MSRSLRIGVCCYPTYGGSGVLATELGMALGRRGHQVHFICSERPERLAHGSPNVTFHRVQARDYPVFPHTPYTLALCSAIVGVARDPAWGLDLVHAHYAVPHAVSAWLARQIAGDFRLVTTNHGTDTTLVGTDPSYLPVTRHAMLGSDQLTTPSQWLKEQTAERFDLPADRIEVVPNFVDTDALVPGDDRGALSRFFPDLGVDEPVVVHVSNLRPVKRVGDVVAVFAAAARGRPGRLLVVGDGPDRASAEAAVAAAGLGDRVVFAGNLSELPALLRACSVFLLPSQTESFGLAAAEALACGVPVVASRVGGLPEVVRHGVTGFLEPLGDVGAMASRVGQLLDDGPLRRRMGEAARADVVERFRMGPVVDRYEALYRRVCG
jgi:N-acetyl-alpha-D-glucosaminyl L-malate synthase BshA